MIKKLIVILVIVIIPIITFAATGTITYQGKLMQDGSPANGTYTLQFAIFDAESDGNQLWPTSGSESHSVSISDGLYTIVLGGTYPITESTFDSDEAWIELTIGTTTFVRTKFHTVPYSFKADGISGVTPGEVTAGKPLVVNDNKDLSGLRNITIGAESSDYTLPNARGSAGQILQTDGNGNVSWQSPSTNLSPGINVGDILRWNGTSWEEVTLKYFYPDMDNDGYGDKFNRVLDFSPPNEYYIENGQDCNDASSSNTGLFYLDSDGDGHGDENYSIENTNCSNTPPSGYAMNKDDCDDDNASYWYPRTYYSDSDGDGYGDGATATQYCVPPSGWVLNDEDCDDTDSDVYMEVWWYLDSDGDGYGNPNGPTTSCHQPEGHVSNPWDCDDGNANVYPGAPEIPDNEIDDDCDGSVDE